MKKTNLIIFCYNRVNHIKVLLKNIKYLTNRKIYIVCDGPKNNEEDYKSVKLVRNLISNSKLNIKKKMFLKKNIGIRNIFSLGLNWVFKHEKK